MTTLFWEKTNATNNARIKINGIEWFVPHYSTSMQQQNLISKQILNRTPKELQYVARSILLKEVNTRNFWTFELGTLEGIHVTVCILIDFQQTDNKISQILNNGTFHRLPVTSVQCIIGTKKILIPQ